MNRKVLIAYATRHESTAEVARVIGAELTCRGMTADVLSVEEVGGIRAYEAVEFIRTHQAALRRIPVAVFTLHVQATSDSEEDRRQRESYLDGVRAILQPQHEAWFSGSLDQTVLTEEERLACPMPNVSLPWDQRDWDDIRAWARRIL